MAWKFCRKVAGVGAAFAVAAAMTASQAHAIVLVATQQSLTATEATYLLELDFTDSLPANLGEVNVVRVSVAGSDAALDGRFHFDASPTWDLLKDFGDAPDLEAAELFWGLANPGTGMLPGSSDALGLLVIDLSGLSGQTLAFRLDGGSDPLVDQTVVIGPDSDDPSGFESVVFQPEIRGGGFQFDVPDSPGAGEAIPEPATIMLGLISLAALVGVATRRHS